MTENIEIEVRIIPLIEPLRIALYKHNIDEDVRTEIYNRAYEALAKAIKNYNSSL